VPALALGGAFAAKRYLVPRVIDAQVRDAFAAAGFPGARFRIAELGLDHVELVDTTLGAGLDLGEVTLDTGIAALWGRRAERVAIRGAHVVAAALAPDSDPARGANAWPRLRVELDDCTIDVAGARLIVSGALALETARPIAAELAATSEQVRFGTIALEHARIELHADRGTLHARAEADLAVDATAELVLAGAHVSAAIDGAVAPLALDVAGDLDAIRARIGAAALDAVHVPFDARVSWDRGRVAFAPRGELEAHARSLELALGGATLHATAPVIALPAETLAHPRRIAWRAARACWRGACLNRPSGTLDGAAGERRRVRWRAASASWAGALFTAPSGTSAHDVSWSRGEHVLAWTGVAGPGPIELGAGAAALSSARGELAVTRASAAALGGELVLAPLRFTASGATPVKLLVRGVALERVLASLGAGGVRGSGRLDGELALRVAHGLEFVGGSLHARGGGRLELGAFGGLAAGLPHTLPRGVRERIFAALASFSYTQLAAVVSPDLAVQLALRGRGDRVPQDLDVVVNLHGVRDAMQRVPLSRLVRSIP